MSVPRLRRTPLLDRMETAAGGGGSALSPQGRAVEYLFVLEDGATHEAKAETLEAEDLFELVKEIPVIASIE